MNQSLENLYFLLKIDWFVMHYHRAEQCRNLVAHYGPVESAF